MRVIILFNELEDELVVTEIGGEVVDHLSNIPNLYIAEIPDDKLEELRSNPKVNSVDIDTPTMANTATGNGWSDRYEDSYYVRMMRLSDYWSRGITGKGVKVASLDTGINPHYLLKPTGGFNATGSGESWNIDTSNHGTGTSGFIIGRTFYSYAWGNTADAMYNYRMGRFSGVAPDCEFYMVRCGYNSDLEMAYIYASAVISGLNWCIENGIEIINNSYGGMTPTTAMTTAFQSASDAGIIIIVSSGNGGTSDDNEIKTDYPSSLGQTIDNMVVVGGIDKKYKRSQYIGLTSYPSTNQYMDLTAPSHGLLRAFNNYIDGNYTIGGIEESTYTTGNGTSYSAPMVTGIFALYKQVYPNKTAQELIQIVKDNAMPLGIENAYGKGLPMPSKEILSIPKPTNGEGMVFDGNGDNIVVGNNDLISIGSNMTIEIDFTQSWGNQGYIMSKEIDNSTPSNREYSLYLGDDGIYMGYTYNNAGTITRESVFMFVGTADGRRHNLTIVISPTNIIYYWDGERIANNSYTMLGTPIKVSGADLVLGKPSFTPSSYSFKGTIHNFRIYNRSLPASEVIENMNGNVTRTNLQLEYLFEDGDATDTSPNGFHGTVYGARPSVDKNL